MGRAGFVLLAPMPKGAHDTADLRGVVTAARIGAPDGHEELVRALTAEADRYATTVLVLPEAEARPIVAAAVRHVARGRPVDGDDVIDRLHLAVRTEVFRRQPGARLPVRVVAAAALVVVLLGFGAFALSLGGDDGDDGGTTPSVAVAAVTADAVVLEGRVVTDGGSGGTPDVEVQVLADGEAVGTARTDDDGRFSVEGLAAGTYDLRVTAPGGLRLPGGTATVDLTDRDAGAVLLRLERP